MPTPVVTVTAPAHRRGHPPPPAPLQGSHAQIPAARRQATLQREARLRSRTLRARPRAEPARLGDAHMSGVPAPVPLSRARQGVQECLVRIDRQMQVEHAGIQEGAGGHGARAQAEAALAGTGGISGVGSVTRRREDYRRSSSSSELDERLGTDYRGLYPPHNPSGGRCEEAYQHDV